MSSVYRQQLGNDGEKVAIQFLRSKRFFIRETNFRCSAGEIDIIAEEKGVIVFVEVKTRSSKAYGLPQEAVDYYKQKKLIQLARYYLQREQLQNKGCRFDVISIIMKNKNIEKIDHFVDAFSA